MDGPPDVMQYRRINKSHDNLVETGGHHLE
jgi:hypothetical protein